MLKVALHPYILHFKQSAGTSRGVLTERRIHLLRAWDDANPAVAGWGECGPVPALSRDDLPGFANMSARMCASINEGSDPATLDLSVLPSFAFGLETALRDLATGGRQRLWNTPFSRGEQGLPTHGLIWMDSIEGSLRQIEAKIGQGFGVVKMKVGALPFDQELALLGELRRAHPAGQIELRLDANGAFEPREALAMLDRLAEFCVAFLEQPIRAGQWKALAELCRHSPIPLALDEDLIEVADAEGRLRLLDTVRPQHLVLKPALLGGFHAAEEWIVDAEVRGIQWWINSLLESNIGLNAICQWASAIGGKRVHGLGTGTLFTNNIPAPIQLAGNELVIPPRHALGVSTH